jgi:hypothetical protein
MDRSLFLRLVLFGLACLLAACQPEIGDECQVSTDCSAAGDRLCDTTQPAGYCTIFNCEPGTCPDEALCVGFGNTLSRAPACVDRQGGSRFQRIFCMAKCEDADDCRSGYECVDLARPNPIGAIIVEHGASRGEVDGRVCAVPFHGVPVSSEVPTEVCTGTDSPLEPPPWTPNLPEGGGVDAGGTDAGDAADAADGEGGVTTDAPSDA